MTNEITDKISKGRKRKIPPITETTFKFSQDRCSALKYQGKNDRPDRRFDSQTESLCLMITSNGQKTFYAVGKPLMFNKKKQKMERNASYKKMFALSSQKKSYDHARNVVQEYVAAMENPTVDANADEKFSFLAKEFLSRGMSDYRLADSAEKHEYKEGTIKKYTKLINTYLLLKSSKHITTPFQKNRFGVIVHKLSEVIVYNGMPSTLPFKDIALKSLDEREVNILHHRLKETPTVANDVLRVVSVIISWSRKQKLFRGENPCDLVTKFQEQKIKAKLPDDQVVKVMNHCKSKAFESDPQFLCFIALLLLLGKRQSELYGLRWKEPFSKKEINECSGWLLPNYAKTKYAYLRDTKNRKIERVYLDSESIAFIERMDRLRYEGSSERKTDLIKSAFLFPTVQWQGQRHITDSSFRKKLIKLNEKLELTTTWKDADTGEMKVQGGLQFKLGRKTAISKFEEKFGIEIASKKANHSSTKVTRDHYVVKDDKELEIENIYQNKIAKEDIIKGVIETLPFKKTK